MDENNLNNIPEAAENAAEFAETELLNATQAPAYEAPAAPAYEAPAAPAYEAPAAPAYEAPAAPAYEAPAAPAYEAPAYGAAPAYGEAPVYGAAPAYGEAPAFTPAPEFNKPKKKKTGLIVGLCIAAAVLIAAALVWFLVLTPSSVTISQSHATVEIGKTVTLSADVNPGSALNKDLTWDTSDSSVATVTSDGIVKGISRGTCTITVSTSNGKTASCDLEVTMSKYDAAVIGNWDCYNFLTISTRRSFNPHDIGESVTLELYEDYTYKLTISDSTTTGNWEYEKTDSDGDYKYNLSSINATLYYIVDDGDLWFYFNDYCLTFGK